MTHQPPVRSPTTRAQSPILFVASVFTSPLLAAGVVIMLPYILSVAVVSVRAVPTPEVVARALKTVTSKPGFAVESGS